MEFETKDTKSLLFLAGVREFAAKGYKGATVRSICTSANSANVNALNYYFGGKEKLYKAILDTMFGALGNRWDQIDATAPVNISPSQKLKFYMKVYCELLYAEDKLARDFTAIFLSEMIRPSDFLQDAMEAKVAPQTERFLALIHELLPPDASATQARHCLVSILGPLLYPAVVRPAIQNFFSGTVTDDLESFVDHSHQFALAGLDRIRETMHKEDLS